MFIGPVQYSTVRDSLILVLYKLEIQMKIIMK